MPMMLMLMLLMPTFLLQHVVVWICRHPPRRRCRRQKQTHMRNLVIQSCDCVAKWKKSDPFFAWLFHNSVLWSKIQDDQTCWLLTKLISIQYLVANVQVKSSQLSLGVSRASGEWKLMTNPPTRNGLYKSFWAPGSTSDMTAAKVGCTSTFTGDDSSFEMDKSAKKITSPRLTCNLTSDNLI